ncbi:hypothetical protein HPB51_006046 [Rhipicephalus microplus]|uniref:Uncharacterized protein n=1 Tax=Rhipicephalus microplus TaxID=6941 RepID=A0A9J6D8Q5_RHIMP|nr:hypothetical protein HPB51_006046 [Rhipicephalus microplus]
MSEQCFLLGLSTSTLWKGKSRVKGQLEKRKRRTRTPASCMRLGLAEVTGNQSQPSMSRISMPAADVASARKLWRALYWLVETVEVSLAGRGANGGDEAGGRLSALAGCCPSCPSRGGLVSAAAGSRATVELDRRMVPFYPGAVTSRKPSSRRYRQASLCKATLPRFWSAAFLYDILRTRGPIAAHHAFKTPRGQFSFDYPVHQVTR